MHYIVLTACLLLLMLMVVTMTQHVVFGICRLIDFVVPDVPQSLDLKIKRERYLARQALADSAAATLVYTRVTTLQIEITQRVRPPVLNQIKSSHHTVFQKKETPNSWPYLCHFLTDFQNFFTDILSGKFAALIPLHLKRVAALPWES